MVVLLLLLLLLLRGHLPHPPLWRGGEGGQRKPHPLVGEACPGQ